MTAYIKLKLKATGQRNKGRRYYDVNKRNDPHKKKRFVLHLKKTFEALTGHDEEVRNPDEGINENWSRVTALYKEISKECLGQNKTKKGLDDP